ncbi:MAG: gliding motility protein [bacterium]|nr:gliding motility protein [bacterium]
MSPSTAAALTEAPPPDAELLATRHAGRLKPRDTRALHRWLSSLPADTSSLEVAMRALEAAGRWLRGGGALTETEPAPIVRLRLLVDVLEEVPSWRRAVAAVVTRVCAEGDAMPALEAGLPNDRGLWPESADRLSRRFLPSADSARDLGALVSRMFPTMRDAVWLAFVPDDLAAQLVKLLDDGTRAAGVTPPFAPLHQATLDVIALVATRTSALGLSREIRARSPEVPLAASPFFLLPRLCDALFSGIGSVASCRDQISACRDALEAVRSHLEEFGVSVDVVYRIEVVAKNLDRLRDLLAVSDADGAARAAAAFHVVAQIAAARVRDRSVRDMLSTNLHLLARKVIEHAGETGEHYITTTRKQWWKMLASGAGGGIVTAGTIVMKYLVLWGHFALFVEGAFASLNYATSFLVMQLCGFTLATKQPSMIAAALAGSLHGSSGKERDELDDLVTLIQRICRSQLGAAIGNVGMVIPAALVFNVVYARLHGAPFLDEHAAEHTIESFHPLHSGTIFFAALTGVLLWMSSLGAGWLENWVTYRRLPEAIAKHPAGRILGRGTMRWIARTLQHNVAGIGGNIAIGFLLGMTPVVGRFFGLPLEVRHVTLSTGSLALAGCTLGLGAPHFLAAVGGIAIMLALNFGVSFACALFVALRARGIDHAGRRLLRAIIVRFVREPLPFLLPVGRDARP